MSDFITFLPTFNAACNATCATLLLVAYIAIRQGRVQLHMRCMLSAVATSALFLTGYLTRMALSGPHHFVGTGGWKIAYLILLFSHMVLAVALLPAVARTLFLASRERFAEHRRIARWVWPVWMYVSVTGVCVYVILYHLAPGSA